MLFLWSVENESLVSFAFGRFSEHFFFIFWLDYCCFVTRLDVFVTSLENSTEIVLNFGFYQFYIGIFEKLL